MKDDEICSFLSDQNSKIKYYIVDKKIKVQQVRLEKYLEDVFKETEEFKERVEEEKIYYPEYFESDSSEKKEVVTKYDINCVAKLDKLEAIKKFIKANIDNLSLVKMSIFITN